MMGFYFASGAELQEVEGRTQREERKEKRLLEKSSLSPAVPPPLTHMAYPADIDVESVAKRLYDVDMTVRGPFLGLFLLRSTARILAGLFAVSVFLLCN